MMRAHDIDAECLVVTLRCRATPPTADADANFGDAEPERPGQLDHGLV